MEHELQHALRVLLTALAALGGGWLALRFLLPWTAPLLLALALAAGLEAPVRLLIRHRWPRPAAAALCTLALLGLLLWGLTALAGRAAALVTAFAAKTPVLMEALARTLDRIEARSAALAAAAPEGTGELLLAALDSAAQSLYGLPGLLSQQALDLLARAAQSSGGVLLFIATAGIGTYFCSAAYPKVTAFLLAQLPRGLTRRLSGLDRDLRASFGALLRAQLMLMAMTFFQLLLAFVLLGIPGAAGLAALIALVDALPVLGTGTVLLPWALGCLLLGQVSRGLGLGLCWALICLVRSGVQAKLLGDQIGLDPLASLVAIYVGWRICGVWGMLLFPVLLVTLQQLNEKGVLRLWRTP